MKRSGWERLRVLRRLKRLLCFVGIHQDVRVQRTSWHICEQCLRERAPAKDQFGRIQRPDRPAGLGAFKKTLARARKDRDGA